MGAVIGRVGNRTANAKFNLDGKEYTLAQVSLFVKSPSEQYTYWLSLANGGYITWKQSMAELATEFPMQSLVWMAKNTIFSGKFVWLDFI